MAVILVGGDKGGLGKDLTSEGVYLTAVSAGLNPRLYEIEIEPRMARKFPGSIHIGIGTPSAEELYKQPDILFQPLDQAAEAWSRDELAIVCCGANVTSAFLRWSEGKVGSAFLGKGETLTFACLLTMQDQSLISGYNNLMRFAAAFPSARRFAVCNSVIADFVQGDPNIERALRDATGSGLPIEMIRIRRMSAPCWGYLMNMGRLDELLKLNWEALTALGLPMGDSLRSMAVLESWVPEFLAAVAPIVSSVSSRKDGKRGRKT
jgi:hypothetical protein